MTDSSSVSMHTTGTRSFDNRFSDLNINSTEFLDAICAPGAATCMCSLCLSFFDNQVDRLLGISVMREHGWLEE